MKKLAIVFFIFATLIVSCGIIFSNTQNDRTVPKRNADHIIAVNEIEQLCASGDTAAAQKKAHELRMAMDSENDDTPKDNSSAILTSICLIFLCAVSGYCYIVIIRPFHKLTDFAERIAGGDLDIPLDYERTDYFGKFTWAFDNMRREITKARTCEKEAIENNKTVIASLSHDIKTPVASIRAYAEGLEAGMDSNAEKRAKYLEVIIRKCDEVTKLTNDMLMHSLSDMDKLKIYPEEFELCGFFESIIRDFSAESSDIRFKKPEFFIYVFADKSRTAQIIENIINNAKKYAEAPVEIIMTYDTNFAYMHFRDHGNGIPDEDMPFITDKFYRGHNCADKQGSGLGLYIVKYIAIQSGGDVFLKNLSDGLEVIVSLPLRKNIP